jgi:predicted dehydrogenase
MVKAVRDGGGELVVAYAEDPDPNHAARFFQQNPGVRRATTEREVLEDDTIRLVVSAAAPADRASLGMRVMRAGKDFLADKGGFLDLESLAEARRVQAETGRIYAICYNERVLDPPTVRASELVRAGAIGRVTHTLGTGPHGLFGHGPREDWFWTRAGRGGILADLATHQADQFLHFTGSKRAEVVAARTANFRTPDHPEFEDFGEVMWRGDGGVGSARVDFYEGHSLGIRLTLLGTEGSLEVTKGAGPIVLTDARGRREIRVEPGFVCPYGRQLVDDVLNRTETAMSQAHAFLASELAVQAQLAARREALIPPKA